MLETLSLDPYGAGVMGAIRPNTRRDQGRKAIVSLINPNVTIDVRIGEE